MAADADTLCNTVGVAPCQCGNIHMTVIDMHGQRIMASLDAGEALQIAKALSEAALHVAAEATPALTLQ